MIINRKELRVSRTIATTCSVFRIASSGLFATMSDARAHGQRHSLIAGLLRVCSNELFYVFDKDGLKKLLKLPP